MELPGDCREEDFWIGCTVVLKDNSAGVSQRACLDLDSLYAGIGPRENISKYFGACKPPTCYCID